MMKNCFAVKMRIVLAVIALGCSFCSPKSMAQQEGEKQAIVLLADPTIFYDKGTYYLYGTGGAQYTSGFAVYSSKDLKTWTGPVGAKEGYALKKGDAFGDAKFWAPQVFQYNNKYYMAYAANEHIGMALSENPTGPFVMENGKAISEETKQIDPYVFIDDDGKKYMYYVVVGNGGNRIYVAEMNEDMLSVKKETEKLCIEASQPWENIDPAYDKWPVTEGPTVIRHNHLYYLIYSANHFKSVDYAVGYATSSSPLGPWKKYEGNPVIHKSITGQNGSGHGDLVKGKKGEWLYVFHTHHSAEKIAPRKTAIIKMDFEKDAKTGVDKLVAKPSTFSYVYGQPKTKLDKRPNIIIILADDMGYSDIGCYGGEIQTPNIDYLASQGLRFSQFYNAARCCPTRASLMTGLYSHNAGIGTMSFDQQKPGYRGYMTENTITLAELLKLGGYNTGMVGKWHVAQTKPLPDKNEHLKWLNHQSDAGDFAPIEQYPTSRGFDKYYGTIWGVVNFFDPFSLVNGTEPVKTVPENYYYTDALNDSASAYIREFSKTQQPFFLYVAQTAPHWPLHALPEDIKKYENTYKVGWDAIREQRYKKMIEKGVFPDDKNILSPRYKSQLKWEENPNKDWDAYAMAVRAAMVDRMDQGIGRIIQTLRETGELDNTLILFLSDNGASCDDAQDYGPGLDRPGATRDGKPVIYPVDKKVLPGTANTFASTDTMWSNVANTPFRYWKMESYEGGICTPMVAYWPRGIKAKKGSVTTQPGHVIDFMATVREIAGVDYPKAYKNNTISPTDGVSLLPIFKDQKSKGHDYLFFEHVRGRAVRKGDWKLVSLGEKRGWELYNLKEDRTETNNLAAQYPELVEELKAKWMEWAHSHKVLPKPNAKSKE